MIPKMLKTVLMMVKGMTITGGPRESVPFTVEDSLWQQRIGEV